MKQIILILLFVFSINHIDSQYLTKQYTDEWNQNTWTNLSRTVLNYNPDGKLAIRFTEAKDSEGFWKATEKTTYTYDSNGNLQLLMYSVLNQQSSVWENERKHTLTYHVNHNLAENLIELFLNGEWQNDMLQQFTYDNSDNLILTIEKNWSSVEQIWKESTKLEQTFVNNVLNQNVLSNQNSSFSAWIPYQKTDFTYTPFGKIETETFRRWEMNSWQNNLMINYTYGLDELLISKVNQGWSSTENEWQNVLKANYAYNTDETEREIIAQMWNSGLGVWVNDMKISNDYGVAFVGVNELELQNIVFYPIPVSNMLSFTTAEETSICVFDYQGKLLLSHSGLGTQSLSFTNFPSGLYILEATTNDKKTNYKIIKN